MRFFSRLLRSGISATVLFASLGALAETQIGHVIQRNFNGATGTRSSGGADDLVYTREIFAGEKVTTPAGGSTVMRFRDQTQLQIGANSTVVLDRFVYDPGSQTDSGNISLAKGLFRYIGGQANDAAGVQLSTPTTTLTIRGTKFLVWVKDDGTTTVAVLEGSVDIKPCGNGDVAHAASGQAFQVTSSCIPSPVPVSVIPSDPAITSDASVDNGNGGVGSNGNNGNTPAGPGPSGGGSSGGSCCGKGTGPGRGGGAP